MTLYKCTVKKNQTLLGLETIIIVSWATIPTIYKLISSTVLTSEYKHIL